MKKLKPRFSENPEEQMARSYWFLRNNLNAGIIILIFYIFVLVDRYTLVFFVANLPKILDTKVQYSRRSGIKTIYYFNYVSIGPCLQFEINSVWAVITTCSENGSDEKLFNFFDRSYPHATNLDIQVINYVVRKSHKVIKTLKVFSFKFHKSM